MGMNMARHLMRGGHDVVAYNRSCDKVDELVKEGAVGAYSLQEVVGKLEKPRAAWIMLPAGKPVDDTIDELRCLLDRPADPCTVVIIDASKLVLDFIYGVQTLNHQLPILVCDH